MVVTHSDGVICGAAELSIEESCYIDDTGHLNAVEVMIGYNQMLYYVIAKAVREGLGPVFSGWTMEDYWRRQLPGILITKVTSEFRRPIDPRNYHGEFELTGVAHRRLRPESAPLTALETSFRYWDDHNGRASGQVAVAIVDE